MVPFVMPLRRGCLESTFALLFHCTTQLGMPQRGKALKGSTHKVVLVEKQYTLHCLFHCLLPSSSLSIASSLLMILLKSVPLPQQVHYSQQSSQAPCSGIDYTTYTYTKASITTIIISQLYTKQLCLPESLQIHLIEWPQSSLISWSTPVPSFPSPPRKKKKKRDFLRPVYSSPSSPHHVSTGYFVINLHIHCLHCRFFCC